MFRDWRVFLGVGFLVFVVVLIVIVNARELGEDARRRFTASLDGTVVSIGEDYYTCEHHLRMEDPCDPDVYFSARDPKRDGVLRFTIIDKQKVPAGHSEGLRESRPPARALAWPHGRVGSTGRDAAIDEEPAWAKAHPTSCGTRSHGSRATSHGSREESKAHHSRLHAG